MKTHAESLIRVSQMSLERLLDFNVPLTIILDKLDGISALNLANASLLANAAVHKNLSRNRGRLYWTQRCEQWREDPMLLKVLASYDPIFPKKANRELLEYRVESDWNEAFVAAHDVAYTIRSCHLTCSRLKIFQDRIKTDIVFQYEPSSLSSEFPSRLTGTSGSLAWNILCPSTDKKNNPETVLVFEDMDVCRGAEVADHQQVLRAFVMLIPREDYEVLLPLVTKVETSLVWRLLVSVGHSLVQISSMHGGESCRIQLEQYAFVGNKHKMDPVVSHYKDIIAIWSHPYSLKMYKVSIDLSGNVSADVIAQVDASQGSSKDYMYRLWSRMAQAVDSYIFTVERNNETGVANEANEANEHTFDVTVTFPLAALIYTINPRDQILRVSELHCSPEPSLLLCNEVDQVEGTACAYGLRIYYTSQVLGISRDVNQWYFGSWTVFNLIAQPGADLDVTLVEIIGPNLLVIVSEEIMYFVQVSLLKQCSAAHIENSMVSRQPGFGLDVIRKVNLRLFELEKQIKHLHLDFSKGVPYIWLEANRIKLTDQGEVAIDEHPCSFDLYRLDFC